MMNVVRPSRLEREPWPGGYVGEGPDCSTFGEPLSMGAELELAEGLDGAVMAGRALQGAHRRNPTKVLEIDAAVAESLTRRWQPSPGPRFHSDVVDYVAGDVAPIRFNLANSILRTVPGPDDAGVADWVRKFRSSIATFQLELLTCADPYFLPRPVAWDLLAAEMPAADMAEVRLAGPSLVMFSAGMGIPGEYLGFDTHLLHRMDYSTVAEGDIADTIEEHRSNHAPSQLRATILAMSQDYPQVEAGLLEHPKLGYQLLGALLLPDDDGTLLDAMCWVLRAIDPALTERQIIETDGANLHLGGEPFMLLPGHRSLASLSPIADALAAAVAWGSWTNPGAPIEKLPHRKIRRTKQYRQDHDAGRHLGVHTIDVRPAASSEPDPTAASRTIRRHYRRGYWRRTRIGPKDNWHYEYRYIPPTIVNADQIDPDDHALTIYRLPLADQREN